MNYEEQAKDARLQIHIMSGDSIGLEAAAMTELKVGVRELKMQFSRYLRLVKAGRTIVIANRGQPVGRIVPAGQSLEDKKQAMVSAGLAEWDGKKLKPVPPVARVKAGHSIADIMVEDRI